MGRRQNVEFAGANVHVWSRRVDRWPLFVDDEDYKRYVALLGASVEEYGWLLLSFCLMPNHVHLFVELRGPNLGTGMHRLHMKYVRAFNDRHDRTGRLFEHRFGRKLVTDELYFATLVSYIEQNPVKAGLCSRPDEWPWSSRGIVATGTTPEWLADDVLRARRAT